MRQERVTAFSVAGGGVEAHFRIRRILRYQFACEAAERVRQRLFVLLAVLSAVLWLDTARPSLLSEALVRSALIAWVLVLVTVIAVLVAERHWRNQQKTVLDETRDASEGKER